MKRHADAVKNKIRQTAAFTLAEALVTMIILLLVTSVVVAGIPAAINAYDKVVMASNAEMLMSTAMGELRNELSTAREVEVTDNKVISFYNESTGFNSKIYCRTDNGVTDIMYERYSSSNNKDGNLIDAQGPGEGSDPQARILVSKAASDKNPDNTQKLYVKYDEVRDRGNGIIEFTNIQVTKKDGSDTRALRERYLIKVIAD